MSSPGVSFRSSLARPISDFLSEKRAVGYRYTREALSLRAFDRHLDQLGHASETLPKGIVDAWVARQPHETVVSQRHRVSLIRQLALFLRRRGIEAYVPDGRVMPVARREFAPYVLTRAQIGRLLAAIPKAAPQDGRAPLRHLVMPVLFRLLYGCGLRCGEALRLTVSDVDLAGGVLTVREGKFR